jgi:HTH-type transcriptional regulator, transcriptional repressor of NAD biosynthesis genes
MTDSRRWRRGLTVGKFLPPHAGHHLLISRAARQCDRLTVLVCDLPGQVPAAHVRATWLQEAFPEVDVVVIPDIGHDDDSARWAEYTMDFLGFAPDVVFTSEGYGEAYAHFLGAAHVCVDRKRSLVPVSGTAVRADPLANWRYLPGPARGFYAVRVCSLGAESTGSTTLAVDLAERLGTTLVAEYGREYSVDKYDLGNTTWHTEEFTAVAREQCRREDAAARECAGILVCDTDVFATALWHERYMGFPSPAVEAMAEERRRPGTAISLYLLTGLEIPFVQDGYRDGEHIRGQMHDRFMERLIQTGRPFVEITGSREERVEAAVQAIRELRAGRPYSSSTGFCSGRADATSGGSFSRTNTP